ncbi:MAG: hypothetical protein ACK4XG_08460 [Chromatiaceae bacterium]
MQNKLNSFFALVLCSLLAHLALVALVLQQQFVYQPPQTRPAPLQVFAVTRAPQLPPPVTLPAAEPVAKPPAPTFAPAPPKQPEPKRAATRPIVQAAATPANINPVKISPANSKTAPASAAPADRPLDLSAVFSSVQQQSARRELSAAELAALSAPKTETITPSHAVRRPTLKPGSGPASDVLETLADGTQLVRVGKQCVLAAPGADLRKDIHSMKLVGCGAGGNSEQDKIDAHFEQVMSKIGQHR